MKKVLYIDMDNVLVNFQSGIDKLPNKTKQEYLDRLDEVPGIFRLMEPVNEAVESFETLSKLFDTDILSTTPWNNSSDWHGKHV